MNKPVMNAGSFGPSQHPEQQDEKTGSDTGSWEQGTGEGSASALHRMKHQQRSRSEATPFDDKPSSN